MYLETVINNIRDIFLPDIFMVIYIVAFIAIYIGMRNPSLVIGNINVRQTKGMVLLIYGSVFAVSVLLNILTAY